MTNEKLLFLVNKAIDALKDKTDIEHMRQYGIKTADKVPLAKDYTACYLEEIRCNVLADIEAAEAKKNGKSSALSAIKRMCKDAYNKCIQSKPILAYAHYDETENKYVLTNNYWLLVTENLTGLTLKPEYLKGDYFNWKAHVRDYSNAQTVELPSIGKLSAYRKQKKSAEGNRYKDVVVLNNSSAINAGFLEDAMKVTGATTIKVIDHCKPVLIEGNGYSIYIMQIKNTKNLVGEDEEVMPPTDFDNV